jgi:hypothetical protein
LERGFLRLAGRAAKGVRVERLGDGKGRKWKIAKKKFWRLGGRWRKAVQIMVDECKDAQIDNRSDL